MMNGLKIFYKRYRYFLISLIVIVVLGIIVDIQAMIHGLSKLFDEEQEIQAHVVEKKAALSQVSPLASQLNHLRLSKPKRPLLEQILLATKTTACQVIDLRLENNKSTVLNLQLIANYYNFFRLLEILTQQGLPLHVDHLQMKKQGDFLTIQSRFSVYPSAYWLAETTATSSQQNRVFSRDPFEEAALNLE